MNFSAKILSSPKLAWLSFCSCKTIDAFIVVSNYSHSFPATASVTEHHWIIRFFCYFYGFFFIFDGLGVPGITFTFASSAIFFDLILSPMLTIALRLGPMKAILFFSMLLQIPHFQKESHNLDELHRLWIPCKQQ